MRGLIVGVGAALSGLLRLLLTGDPFVGPWAEDGAEFLAGAASHPWTALWSGYNGYGHFVPRVLAAGTVEAPVGWWPTIAVASSLAVTGALAAFVFGAARRSGVTAWLAAAAALVPLVLPGSGGELLANWANLQWHFLYAAAWALMVTAPRTLDLVVLGFAAATSPVTLALLPLLVVAHRRVSTAVAMGVGLLYHGIVALGPGLGTGDRSATEGLATVTDVVDGAVRAFATSALEVPSGGRYLAGSAMLIGAVFAVCVSRHRRAGLLALSAVAMAGVLGVTNSLVASRYSAACVALLLVAVCVSGGRAASGIFAAVGIAAVVSFAAPTVRLALPDWEPQCVDGVATSPVGPHDWSEARFPCASRTSEARHR